MVISCGIAFYDDPSDNSEVKRGLLNLHGVRKDIGETRHLFENELEYDMFPDYSEENIDNYRAYWKEKN